MIVVVIATTLGGQSAPSLAGAWINGDSTFTFTPSGSSNYAVSELTKAGSKQCYVADDGTVTGSNGHYRGNIDLYPQGGTGPCPTKIGVAQVTIALAANGASANLDVVGDINCSDCGEQTWTRQS